MMSLYRRGLSLKAEGVWNRRCFLSSRPGTAAICSLAAVALTFILARPPKEEGLLVIGKGVRLEWLYLFRGSQPLMCERIHTQGIQCISHLLGVEQHDQAIAERFSLGRLCFFLCQLAMTANIKHDLSKQILFLKIRGRLTRSFTGLNRQGEKKKILAQTGLRIGVDFSILSNESTWPLTMSTVLLLDGLLKKWDGCQASPGAATVYST
jgi:hypothetical protein